MTNLDIAHQRLHNHLILDTGLDKPEEVVRWLGAVQAQDLAGAKWGVGLRCKGCSETVVEQSFNSGAILRTHLMRPTWHFVAPEDIRWLLALTAPSVHTRLAYMYRQCELDATILNKSAQVIVESLRGGNQLTRPELALALAKAGIVAAGMRLAHLLMYAELEGVICSGAQRGKQSTYALLDERVPIAKALTRDEALAELVQRYFTSHGPATLADFAGWSGLKMADAKAGLEMVKSDLETEKIDQQTYIYAASSLTSHPRVPTAFLLPPYDEYTIAYKHHEAILQPSFVEQARNSLFGGVIAINGLVTGYWRRTFIKGEVAIELAPFRTLMQHEVDDLSVPATAYSSFLQRPIRKF